MFNPFLSQPCVTNSFCNCNPNALPLCHCAEIEGHIPKWTWSNVYKTTTVTINENKQDILIHGAYSRGTGCVRGDTAFIPGHCYYWEIKLTSRPCGTSVMLGVCTEEFKVDQMINEFGNLLGSDTESWGINYRGFLHESGQIFHYLEDEFTLGSVIGLYLDLFAGTLEFYLNRRPLGIAFNKLQGKTLYPVVSSTSSFTSFRLTYTCSFMESLFTRSLRRLNNSQKSLLPPLLLEKISNYAFWDLPIPKRKPKPTRRSVRVVVENGSTINTSLYINEETGLIDIIPTPKKRRISNHFVL